MTERINVDGSRPEDIGAEADRRPVVDAEFAALAAMSKDTISKLSADWRPLRRRWRSELGHAGDGQCPMPIPQAVPRSLAWQIGLGLDARLRRYFALDPRPLGIPDPPPWDPHSLRGYGWAGPTFAPTDGWQDLARRVLEFRSTLPAVDAGSPVPKDGWTVPEEWAKPLVFGDPFTPLRAHPAVLADLDRLTEAAIAVLGPEFGHRPLVDAQHPVWDALQTDGPDLVLGSTLLEVKASERPGLPGEWLRQLIGYVLRDREDALAIGEVAFWMARWGRLVRIELGELILGGNDPDVLARARREFDVVTQARAELLRKRSEALRPS